MNKPKFIQPSIYLTTEEQIEEVIKLTEELNSSINITQE